jgi:DNA-binding transcriptional regulator PaaX
MSEKNREVAKNIILALGVIGFVSAATVMPGLAGVIPLFEKIKRARVNQEFKRLQRRGLVEFSIKRDGSGVFKLTKKGRERLKRYKIDELFIEKPKIWDKKWRIIAFDIPITKNASRKMLRDKMKEMGFYKLQASVFIYPYPCYEVVEYLRNFLGINSEVEYIEADKLDSQNKLIAHFFKV